jgi:hypothetical protein
MFCPSCGTESPIELNYCNRCGANLSAVVASAPSAPVNVTKPILIIGLVMLFITLAGFAGVFSTAIDLSTRTGSKDVPMAVIFFGMLGIVIIDALLFSLLWKLINAALSSAKAITNKQQGSYQQPQFVQPTTARLQPAPSVTENTTRFFEEYPRVSMPYPVPVKKTNQ